MYEVEFSQEADADLERLFDFALQRELDSETGDLDVAYRVVQANRRGVDFLKSSPFACRKVGISPFIRELVISFGSSGYVALFEIVNGKRVIIGAIRHLREDDYH